MISAFLATLLAVSAVGASIAVALGIAACFLLIGAIGKWQMFKKAGIEGWKAIIPVYSDWLEFRLAWPDETLSIVWVILTLLNGGTNSYETVQTQSSAPVEITYEVTSQSPITRIVSIAYLVFSVLLGQRMSRAFGKGTLFGFVYALFPWIGQLILGFGSARYYGPQQI